MITGNQCIVQTRETQAGQYANLLNSFLVTIGEIDQAIEPLDMSVLATLSKRKYRAGDLIEPGQMELTAFFDPQDADEMFSMIATSHAPGLRRGMLVRYQLAASGNTPATLEGTGFVVNRVYPELINDQLAQARFMWQWDGMVDLNEYDQDEIGPVFTKES